ncbi:max-like protein X [Antedon mediterranea]|uniref:max-like protein X n=1 Tax=Antedon mediterranea TaxID=105859 RepID=UPI003AF7A52D
MENLNDDKSLVTMSADSSFADSSFDHSFTETDVKVEAQSLSRQNSLPRNGSSSSLQLTDEDEEGDQNSYLSPRDRRRSAHTAAEQKRRDAIKKGYEDLQCIVPTCHQSDPLGSGKLSKATVLQRSIDYIQHLVKKRKEQDDNIEALRKEVMALKIMKANYEQIVKAHQSQPGQGQNQVSDHVKFNVFKAIMDAQFETFNQSISVASFAELSACVFSWLEEYCKPQTLKELVVSVLRQMGNQLR